MSVVFATGVLSIPTAMYGLGAIGGSLSVIGWGSLNTYFAIVQGNFRMKHTAIPSPTWPTSSAAPCYAN
jgi:hypothetical protein